MRLVKQKEVGNMKNRVDCPVVTCMTLAFLMVTEHYALNQAVITLVIECCKCLSQLKCDAKLNGDPGSALSPSRLSVLRVSGQTDKLSGSMRLITFVC